MPHGMLMKRSDTLYIGPGLAWLIEFCAVESRQNLIFIGSLGRELGIRRGREVESREIRER
jgi:hypothetical protein